MMSNASTKKPFAAQLSVIRIFLFGAVAAPAKRALFVMAVFGLRSRNPSVRTAHKKRQEVYA